MYPEVKSSQEVHMNISLTPELEQLVNDKVKSGLYQTASEVIRDGLRLLKERDQRL
jgi:antitoxin ParD1/3/4